MCCNDPLIGRIYDYRCRPCCPCPRPCPCPCPWPFPPTPFPPTPFPPTPPVINRGNMARNSGFEIFTGGLPNDFTSATPTLVTQQTDPTRVHSGASAVSLANGGILTQTITGLTPLRPYEFAVFANASDATGAFTATLNYITASGDVPAGTITVLAGSVPSGASVFGYYNVITTPAPIGALGVRIDITAAATGTAVVNFNDISLKIR